MRRPTHVAIDTRGPSATARCTPKHKVECMRYSKTLTYPDPRTPAGWVSLLFAVLLSVCAPTPCLSINAPKIVILGVHNNPVETYSISVDTMIDYDRESIADFAPCPLDKCHYGIYLVSTLANGNTYTSRMNVNPQTITAPKRYPWSGYRWLYYNNANVSTQRARPPSNAKNMRVCFGLNPYPGEEGYGPLILEYANDCADVPAPPVTCTTEDPVTLDHGVLSADQVNGHTTTSLLGLSCSGPATLRISMATERINLGDGIKSRVTVNGVSAGGIVSSEGPIVITSQLSSSGPVEGPHSGSGVIILTIQ